MSADTGLLALRLFSEKAAKLYVLSFTQSILNEPSGFRMSWNRDAGSKSERYGPSEEAIDAFVLTLRFFIQDNELCSLRNMTGHFDALHAAGLISNETHRHWHEARDTINGYLDSPTFFTDTWKDQDGNLVRQENYTNRRIMLIFVYGGLAHSDPEKTPHFKRWQSIPIIFPFLQNIFVNVVGNLVYTLDQMRQHIVEPTIGQVDTNLAASFSGRQVQTQ